MEDKKKVVEMKEEGTAIVMDAKPSLFKRAINAVKANKKAIITGVIGVILGGAGTYLAMKSGDSDNDDDIPYLPESSYSEDSNTEE